MFSEISLLPFAHLEGVEILSCPLVQPFSVGIQQILSVPTLRHVSLDLEFNDPATFLRVWDRCSRTIRSLSLSSQQGSYDTFNSVSQRRAIQIDLEFLHIPYMNDIVPDWLQHETCPFDFSRLKVLSVGRDPQIPDWPIFAPAATQTIETLDFEVQMSLQ